MTKPRSIDEVLDTYKTEWVRSYSGDRKQPSPKDNAKQELKQLLLSEMPKEKRSNVGSSVSDFGWGLNNGYNQALKEVQQTIERIMG